MRGHSLLVVPLPGLVSVVPPLARGPVVPHIPLVDPFAELSRIDDGVLAELGAFFADVVPFAVRLTGLSEYPGGPAYLAPDPTAPFRRLTQGLLHLFPELPRPRPRFERVPHLAVETSPGEDVEVLGEQLDPWLPVATLARHAALWWQEDGVQTLAMFPFGTSAA